MIVPGTLVLRYSPTYGWQVFDWMPGYPATINGTSTLAIRDVDDKVSLLRITGLFTQHFRKRGFIKAPHKYLFWPNLPHPAGFIAPGLQMPTNDWLARMWEDLQRDPLEPAAITCPKHDTGGGPCYCLQEESCQSASSLLNSVNLSIGLDDVSKR